MEDTMPNIIIPYRDPNSPNLHREKKHKLHQKLEQHSGTRLVGGRVLRRSITSARRREEKGTPYLRNRDPKKSQTAPNFRSCGEEKRSNWERKGEAPTTIEYQQQSQSKDQDRTREADETFIRREQQPSYDWNRGERKWKKL